MLRLINFASKFRRRLFLKKGLKVVRQLGKNYDFRTVPTRNITKRRAHKEGREKTVTMDEHNYYDNDGEYNDEVTEYNGGKFENIQALVELEAEHSTNMNNDMGQQQQPSSNMPTYDGELDETLVSEMKDIFALFE